MKQIKAVSFGHEANIRRRKNGLVHADTEAGSRKLKVDFRRSRHGKYLIVLQDRSY